MASGDKSLFQQMLSLPAEVEVMVEMRQLQKSITDKFSVPVEVVEVKKNDND
jgi:hypothetical protein